LTGLRIEDCGLKPAILNPQSAIRDSTWFHCLGI
jgi:hypothetical protein